MTTTISLRSFLCGQGLCSYRAAVALAPFSRVALIQLCCVVLLLLFCKPAAAQGLDELEIRQRVALAYRGKDFTISAKYYLQNYQGGFVFDRSVYGVEGTYKLTPWLKLGAEYRFLTSYQEDAHRFYLYTTLSRKFAKKWELNYRLAYQHEQLFFDSDALSEYPPVRQLRHLLELEYGFNRKTTVFGGIEFYDRITAGGLSLRRVVYAIGGSYLYKGRNQWGLELGWHHRPESLTRPNTLRITAQYTYILGEKKGKKKKKKVDVPPLD